MAFVRIFFQKIEDDNCFFCKSGSGPSYERSRPVTSESSFEADEDDDEGRRLEGRLVEQQGRRKESGLRQAKAFTKGSRASRSCGRHFKESQTSVGGKICIYLLDNLGHGELLELQLLEKSARHDFIIARHRSSNNIFSCQLLESS